MKDSAAKCFLFVALFLLMTTELFAQTSPQQGGESATGQSSSGGDMINVIPGTQQTMVGGDRSTQRIAREVRHELALLPNYSIFDDLKFNVQGYTVTLGGSAISVGLKRDAEAAVKNVEGVEKVVNNIKELPPSGTDQRIRESVARRIASFGPLSRYFWGASVPIHIIVDSGHVTLTGVVDNQSDKNAAGIQANSTPGVFSVANNLKIAQSQSASK